MVRDRPQHSEPYVGRFAPSPTGDLHFGSLVAAVGSYLQARARGGRWLVRIEDIDPPREVAGSAARILGDLRRYGMHPDGEVLYQSTRADAHAAAIAQLLAQGDAFPCACTRSMLPASGVYPGTCRARSVTVSTPGSIRLRVDHGPIAFTDRVMGRHAQDLAATVGDFVIRRSDGLPAYHLAVVVDDAEQGITEIVRGADLLDSTPRQMLVHRRLGLTPPRYLHLPVAVNPDGSKLSKRLRSDPVNLTDPADGLAAALRFLGHAPPAGLDLARLWEWGHAHWDVARIPSRPTIAFCPDTLKH